MIDHYEIDYRMSLKLYIQVKLLFRTSFFLTKTKFKGNIISLESHSVLTDNDILV